MDGGVRKKRSGPPHIELGKEEKEEERKRKSILVGNNYTKANISKERRMPWGEEVGGRGTSVII